MRQWVGALKPTRAPFREESAVWDQGHTITDIVQKFQQGRDEQITLLKAFNAWDELRDTFWGNVNMRWVVSKALQHTYAHMNRVLQIALFWDLKR